MEVYNLSQERLKGTLFVSVIAGCRMKLLSEKRLSQTCTASDR